jgi:hypothetical protein
MHLCDAQDNSVYVSLVPRGALTRLPAGTPYIVELITANLYSLDLDTPGLTVRLEALGSVTPVTIMADTSSSPNVQFTGNGPWDVTVDPYPPSSVVTLDLIITLTTLGNFSLKATIIPPLTLTGGATPLTNTNGSVTTERPVVRTCSSSAMLTLLDPSLLMVNGVRIFATVKRIQEVLTA